MTEISIDLEEAQLNIIYKTLIRNLAIDYDFDALEAINKYCTNENKSIEQTTDTNKIKKSRIVPPWKENWIIKIINDTPPLREGSFAYSRFKLYKDGSLIRTVLGKEVSSNKKGKLKEITRKDINDDIKKGLILLFIQNKEQVSKKEVKPKKKSPQRTKEECKELLISKEQPTYDEVFDALLN